MKHLLLLVVCPFGRLLFVRYLPGCEPLAFYPQINASILFDQLADRHLSSVDPVAIGGLFEPLAASFRQLTARASSLHEFLNQRQVLEAELQRKGGVVVAGKD